MAKQEQPNNIHPHTLMSEKSTIPLASQKNESTTEKSDADVATIPLSPQKNESTTEKSDADVAAIPLKTESETTEHKLLMPDDNTLPLKPETNDDGHKLLMPDDNTLLTKDEAVKASDHVEANHNLLMPDTPTLRLKPVAEASSIKSKPDLRQRVIRALNKRKPQRINKRTTTVMPALNMDVQVYGQVEPRKATVPVNPIHDAPASPFSASYVTTRLNRSIGEAQTAKKYNEAIRLQLLMWKMEDKEISPIEVARKAWLRPAVERAAEKPAS